MLRVEMQELEDGIQMKLEGRFVDEYAREAQATLSRGNGHHKLTVDLTDVTFVDATGEAMLSLFARMGAKFIADNAYGRFLCERLGLPLNGHE